MLHNTIIATSITMIILSIPSYANEVTLTCECSIRKEIHIQGDQETRFTASLVGIEYEGERIYPTLGSKHQKLLEKEPNSNNLQKNLELGRAQRKLENIAQDIKRREQWQKNGSDKGPVEVLVQCQKNSDAQLLEIVGNSASCYGGMSIIQVHPGCDDWERDNQIVELDAVVDIGSTKRLKKHTIKITLPELNAKGDRIEESSNLGFCGLLKMYLYGCINGF